MPKFDWGLSSIVGRWYNTTRKRASDKQNWNSSLQLSITFSSKSWATTIWSWKSYWMSRNFRKRKFQCQVIRRIVLFIRWVIQHRWYLYVNYSNIQLLKLNILLYWVITFSQHNEGRPQLGYFRYLNSNIAYIRFLGFSHLYTVSICNW
jgi:hypothetical protein